MNHKTTSLSQLVHLGSLGILQVQGVQIGILIRCDVLSNFDLDSSRRSGFQ